MVIRRHNLVSTVQIEHTAKETFLNHNIMCHENIPFIPGTFKVLYPFVIFAFDSHLFFKKSITVMLLKSNCRSFHRNKISSYFDYFIAFIALSLHLYLLGNKSIYLVYLCKWHKLIEYENVHKQFQENTINFQHKGHS